MGKKIEKEGIEEMVEEKKTKKTAKSKEPLKTEKQIAIEAFVENASDYTPKETIITETKQIKVGDTDKGIELKQQVEDLKELLNAYYDGTMKTNNTSIEGAIIRLTEKFL